MNRNQMSRVVLIFILFLFSISSFQNCSQQVNFGKLEQQILERSLIVTPKSTTTERSIKVLFVVDNSYTMSQSQEKLSNAVDTLIDGIQDLPIEVSAINTSMSPDSGNNRTISSTINGSIKTEIRQKTPGYIISPPIKLDPKDTTSKREQLKKQIKDRIKSAGTSGDDQERPICAVMAELMSEGSVFKAGDAGTIIFLTDEDDYYSDSCEVVTTYSGSQRYSSGSSPATHTNIYFQGLGVEYGWSYVKDGVRVNTSGYARLLYNPMESISCSDTDMLYKAVLDDDRYNSNSRNPGYIGPTKSDIIKCETITISLGTGTSHINYPDNSVLGQYLYTKYGLSSYFSGYIWGTKPSNVTAEEWAQQEYCDKKFIFPKETQAYTATEYLTKIGFILSTDYSGNACRNWTSGGSEGSYYWDLSKDKSKTKYLPAQLNELLKTNLSTNEAIKKFIETRFGLNNIVISGIYKTPGSSLDQGQSIGTRLGQLISLLNGESSSINSTKYDSAMNRIRELIYQRIVGKRISLSFNPQTEYLKALYLVDAKGNIAKELSANSDYEIHGTEISFTGFEPKHTDQFKVVIETIKIEDF